MFKNLISMTAAALLILSTGPAFATHKNGQPHGDMSPAAESLEENIATILNLLEPKTIFVTSSVQIGQDAGQGAVKDRPLIGAVGEQFPEKGKQTEQGRQQRETAVALAYQMCQDHAEGVFGVSIGIVHATVDHRVHTFDRTEFM